MKRNRISVLAIAGAALCLIGAGRDGGDGGFSHGGGGGVSHGGGGGVSHGGGGGVSRGGGGRPAASPSTVYRRQRVAVPRASMPSPEHTIRDQNRIAYPQR